MQSRRKAGSGVGAAAIGGAIGGADGGTRLDAGSAMVSTKGRGLCSIWAMISSRLMPTRLILSPPRSMLRTTHPARTPTSCACSVGMTRWTTTYPSACSKNIPSGAALCEFTLGKVCRTDRAGTDRAGGTDGGTEGGLDGAGGVADGGLDGGLDGGTDGGAEPSDSIAPSSPSSSLAASSPDSASGAGTASASGAGTASASGACAAPSSGAGTGSSACAAATASTSRQSKEDAGDEQREEPAERTSRTGIERWVSKSRSVTWLSAWAVALSPHATLLAAAQAGEAGTAAAAAIEIWWAMAYAAPYAVCQSWRCRGAAVVLRVSTHCVQCRTARE